MWGPDSFAIVKYIGVLEYSILASYTKNQRIQRTGIFTLHFAEIYTKPIYLDYGSMDPIWIILNLWEGALYLNIGRFRYIYIYTLV